MVNASRPSAERLATYLSGEAIGNGADELAAWLSAVPRFAAFVQAHREKVRKKLRGASDPDDRRDVRAELHVARLLLADRRIELAFEPGGSTHGGPDFALTFRGHPACFVEVTRLRRRPDEAALARVIVSKLRQLPPGLPTALVVAVETTDASTVPLPAVIRSVRSRADAGDPAVLSLARVDGPRAFYQRFLRLGAILAWSETAARDDRLTAWVNPSAQLVIPRPIVGACVAALRGNPIRRPRR